MKKNEDEKFYSGFFFKDSAVWIQAQKNVYAFIEVITASSKTFFIPLKLL